MKPFVEKLHLDKEQSFYIRTHQTPRFEVPWHQHRELELIFFKKGYGTAFVGNYIGEFEEGDVYFLGSNLPHTFQKAKKDQVVSAVVIQFEREAFGTGFLDLPETKGLDQLYEIALQGLKLKRETRRRVGEKMEQLEATQGLSRLLGMLDLLQLLVNAPEFDAVSTQEVREPGGRNPERIDRIYQYTLDHFSDPITLEQVANLASMSVPAFCTYFKKSTKKTYVEFLNEVRIGHACKLLADTQLPVSEICYESGFNTAANFNKQFLKTRKKTPLEYRKLFQGESVRLQSL